MKLQMKYKKTINVIVTLLLMCVLGCVASNETAADQDNEWISDGSAKTLEGTTVVVSIFADDTNTTWTTSSEDIEKISNIDSYLGIACEYLEAVANDYGKKANFIFDFDKYSDLKYNMTFDESVTNQEYIDSGYGDDVVWEYISENIDQDALKEKYDADSVIYYVFVDSDETNTAITCTRTWYEGMPYEYEVIYLFNVDDEEVNCPAVYAHEMLHTFGAPDLYMSDDDYRITDDFVEYVEENMPNDLMLTCSDLTTYEYLYDSISNEVGEVTAYYVGLTDSSEIVDEWNLLRNE